MSDIVQSLGLGLSVAITPAHLWYCFVGALVGTFIGVLPGIGALATISMLLPLTFHVPATTAIIMLAAQSRISATIRARQDASEPRPSAGSPRDSPGYPASAGWAALLTTTTRLPAMLTSAARPADPVLPA